MHLASRCRISRGHAPPLATGCILRSAKVAASIEATAEEVAELKRMWDELDPAMKQQLEEEGRREFEANPNGRLVVGGWWNDQTST